MAKGATTRKGRLRSRVAPRPCHLLGDDRTHEPLNRVWLLDADGKVTKRYAACSCGERFPPADVPRDLPEAAAAHLERRRAGAGAVMDRLDGEAMARVVRELWPVDQESAWARDGVVPVGQRVLHEPTASFDAAAPAVADLAARLLHTQEHAEGIGLAANQVGAPVRALAHNLPRVAPPILLNATLLDQRDEWTYEEGCLSLHLDGTWAEVRRPKVVVVHAELPDGGEIVLEADELFARVLQHEIDHLDGIEYVQRLTGREAERVYGLMRDAGIDTDTWLPPLPYEAPQG
ncbi:MAG TPA: peptide deformylase [Aquihabitans sp.]|jgi:peptide deformylase|nr:peptide deformylase [Aquihabitans sp.]